MPKFFRKNHCSGDNRSGQSTATGLVDAGNARDTVSAQVPFMTESAAPIHRRNHPQITQISYKKFGEMAAVPSRNWTRRSSSLHYSLTAVASLPLRVRM